MPDWARDALAAVAQGPAALVTILATEGSAPRGAGTRMVVTAGSLSGTIGGGALEYRVAEQARALLGHPSGAWRVQDYPLGPLLGQCCGGRVRVLVERLGETGWIAAMEEGSVVATFAADRVERQASGDDVAPIAARGALPVAGVRFVEPTNTPRRPLMLFGAGHVGHAIVRILPGLPFDLAWFDARAEADAPGVTVQDEDALVACAGEAREDAAVLILTHDHALDYHLTAAALRSPAAFVGLIGSQTKRARFLSRLAADGVDATRLTCPIGAPRVMGKEPAVIAVATLAQLLAL